MSFRNVPTLRRICAQSGSSFGSKTTHCVPRNSDSSMYSAVRRTGMYFHSLASESAPFSVRAPQMTRPAPANARRLLIPKGLSCPISPSVSGTESSGTPLSVASSPAGAFHTPRVASVRASTPATAPEAANVSIWLSRSGLVCLSRGKYTAALALSVPRAAKPDLASATEPHVGGASTT